MLDPCPPLGLALGLHDLVRFSFGTEQLLEQGGSTVHHVLKNIGFPIFSAIPPGAEVGITFGIISLAIFFGDAMLFGTARSTWRQG